MGARGERRHCDLPRGARPVRGAGRVADRVPRDARRQGQDAASAHPRRHPRPPRQRRGRRHPRGARDRAVRPRLHQPLPVRAGRGEEGRHRAGSGRDDRRRRPIDAARRGEELQPRRTRLPPGTLRLRARRASLARRALTRDAARARSRGVRHDRSLRGRHRDLVLRARDVSRDARRRPREGARPLVRREPASARGVLRRAARAHASAVARRATARQGALVQQPQRPLGSAHAGARIRAACMRDRQAREPMRCRGRRDTRRGVRAARSPPTRPRRTAASSC